MASAEEAGEFIVEFSDKEYENGKVVLKSHTSVCSQAAKAATGANRDALPTQPFSAWKGAGRVNVYFKSDAADTIESEESDWDITLDLYDKKTGQKISQKVLTAEVMTDFTPSGTVDVVCAAGKRQYVATWEVPDGMYAMLAPGVKFHAYFGDDTV